MGVKGVKLCLNYAEREGLPLIAMVAYGNLRADERPVENQETQLLGLWDGLF